MLEDLGNITVDKSALRAPKVVTKGYFFEKGNLLLRPHRRSNLLKTIDKYGAGDEIRTHDPNLGRSWAENFPIRHSLSDDHGSTE